MEFKRLSTNNKSRWRNSCKYIIIHHTGSNENSIKWVLRTLTVWAVSCHYVIDTNWDVYKIWEDTDILRHAWVSAWWNIKAMNPVSIWIEVIWPLANWFTFEQRSKTKELTKELMQKYNIPKENVLRHADVSPRRKIDIDLRFLNDNNWKPKYPNWKAWQDSLI